MAGENKTNLANQVQPQQGNPAAKNVVNRVQQQVTAGGKNAPVKPEDLEKAAFALANKDKPKASYVDNMIGEKEKLFPYTVSNIV